MPPQEPTDYAFTRNYAGREDKLVVEAGILTGPTKAGKDGTATNVSPRMYDSIWDTGATNSVITQRVVNECGLKPTGMVMVHGATGEKMCETFLIDMLLPNNIVISSVNATKADHLSGCDILVGMDIINLGDFAITHPQGRTKFSFRIPSKGEIDFVKDKPAPRQPQ